MTRTVTRSLPLLAFASVALLACSTARPAPPPPPVDVITEPSIVGAVDEAQLQGSIEAQKGAEIGRRIGLVAGVVAAVFGGPDHESPDDTIDRYFITLDAAEAAGALIGAAKGAKAGAKRGYQLDLQFAELHEIEGLEVTRPYPDQIDVRLPASPDDQTLAAIAAVFAGREERAIEIEGAGDAALALREALADRGVTYASLRAQRNDEIGDVVLRIRYGS
jgi:hypothetical protein